MKVMEEERENCCDQLVLHYGYDKISYASALLTLEKASVSSQVLVLGAAGKKNLLNRIENIIGMEKKNHFKLNQFAGLIAAFFFITIFNSVLIIKDGKQTNRSLSLAYTDITNPFHYFESEDATQGQNDARSNNKTFKLVATVKPSLDNKASVIKPVGNNGNEETATETDENTNTDLANVNYDIIDGSLTPEQKEVVKTTVAATKKIVTTDTNITQTKSKKDDMNKLLEVEEGEVLRKVREVFEQDIKNTESDQLSGEQLKLQV